MRFWLKGIAVALAIVGAVPVAAEMDAGEIRKMSDRISTMVDADADRLKAIFKDIHQNPELGFMETRTAGIVASELATLGYEVKTGIGGTGVVGILRNGPGPVVMWRADMDANAIQEQTGLRYASDVRVTNFAGEDTFVAHMCGHDAHTTWLIGLARVMKDLRDEWSGTLVLVGQPAEEPIAGTQAMVDDGLYSTHGVPEPDYFFAFHTAPVPTGAFISTVGRMTTMTTMVDLTFNGVGGHGSSPHHAKDPIVMAGQAIMALQTILSRRVEPGKTAVVTIGAIDGGVDNNVIPNEATLKLKLHAESQQIFDQLLREITNIAHGIAVGSGLDPLEMTKIEQKGFASLIVNSEAAVLRARELMSAADYVPGQVKDEIMQGSDDAFLLVDGIEGVEKAYYFIGIADHDLFRESWERNQSFPFFVHEPFYKVDLEAIPTGTKMSALLVLDALRN
ncbi:amidohydrolase [Shimia sp. W99]